MADRPGRLSPTFALVAVLGALGAAALLAALIIPAGSSGPALVSAPVEASASRAATPPVARSSGRPPARTQHADLRDKIDGLVLPESEPVNLTIPRIDVRSRLIDLGLEDDGSLEVPEDPELAGWFSRGAAPGALGPAVLAGHVTWNGNPGIFYRLGKLDRGDEVLISREDGRTAVFRVEEAARYAKSRFPDHAVYGPIDHAGLRLITCGGSYDAASGRYLDNVVVYARLESVRDSRG